jgi:hypothetical protein
MMHPQIEDEEIIERYVRNQLAEEERKAFEEHFFGCDACFEKLQEMDRFVAGMRDAGARGLLSSSSKETAAASWWSGWLQPALGLSACAVILLAFMAVRASYFELPRLRRQLDQTNTELATQKQARAALEHQIAQSNQAEVNLPLVMLQATRDGQAAPNVAVLPPGAQHLALWIELPPNASGSFRLEIESEDGRRVQTLENLTRNAYGALSVSLPTEALQSGLYGIRLSRQVPAPPTLLAEYRLRIRLP